MTAEITLCVGDVIANKYRVVSLLGRGTYGEVVAAQPPTGPRVAIKKVTFDLMHENLFIVFREISILRSIDHPMADRWSSSDRPNPSVLGAASRVSLTRGGQGSG